MCKSSKRQNWVFYIIGALLGMLLGVWLGIRFAETASTNLGKVSNVQWQLLGNPHGDISKLLAANPRDVFVERRDGEIYVGHGLDCQPPNQQCWERTDSTNVTEYDRAQLGSDCDATFEDMTSPPYQVQECISVHSEIGTEFYSETHYALLEDGNVWQWRHAVGRMSDLGFQQLTVSLLYPCMGGLLGALCGIGLLVYAIRVRSRPASKIERDSER